jgi:hypothetical protein
VEVVAAGDTGILLFLPLLVPELHRGLGLQFFGKVFVLRAYFFESEWGVSGDGGSVGGLFVCSVLFL